MTGAIPDLNTSAAKNKSTIRNEEEGEQDAADYLRLKNPAERFTHCYELCLLLAML